MSIQAVAAVLDSDVGEVSAKMLLVCLANAHNTATGLCCPSIDRLCKESSMSRSSVKRWLKWLVAEGFIEIEEGYDEHARQTANNYRIVTTTSSRFKLNPSGGRGSSGEPGEGFSTEPLGGSNCEPPLKEPEENRNKNGNASARDGLRREFEDYIWGEFPQNPNSSKARALSAWLALDDAERVSCMRGVARLSLRFDEATTDEPMDRRLKYHQHLSKWIEERGWEAELTST